MFYPLKAETGQTEEQRTKKNILAKRKSTKRKTIQKETSMEKSFEDKPLEHASELEIREPDLSYGQSSIVARQADNFSVKHETRQGISSHSDTPEIFQTGDSKLRDQHADVKRESATCTELTRSVDLTIVEDFETQQAADLKPQEQITSQAGTTTKQAGKKKIASKVNQTLGQNLSVERCEEFIHHDERPKNVEEIEEKGVMRSLAKANTINEGFSVTTEDAVKLEIQEHVTDTAEISSEASKATKKAASISKVLGSTVEAKTTKGFETEKPVQRKISVIHQKEDQQDIIMKVGTVQGQIVPSDKASTFDQSLDSQEYGQITTEKRHVGEQVTSHDRQFGQSTQQESTDMMIVETPDSLNISGTKTVGELSGVVRVGTIQGEHKDSETFQELKIEEKPKEKVKETKTKTKAMERVVSREKSIGKSTVEESTADLCKETFPTKEINVRTEKNQARESATSIDKTIGKAQEIQTVDELTLVEPESQVLKSSKVKNKADGLVSITPTLQGMHIDEGTKKELEPSLFDQSREYGETSTQKRNAGEQATSIDRQVGQSTQQESTDVMQIESPDSVNISGTKYVGELSGAVRVDIIQGEHKDSETFQELRIEEKPTEKVKETKTKTKAKERVVSREKSIGRGTVEESTADLCKETFPTKEVNVRTEKKQARESATFVEKTIGKAQEIQTVDELTLVEPESQVLKSSKVKNKADGLVSITPTMQGMYIDQDTPKELEPVPLLTDTAKIGNTVKATKEHVKSIDKTLGIMNTEESVVNLEVERRQTESLLPKKEEKQKTFASIDAKVLGEQPNIEECQKFQEQLENQSSVKTSRAENNANILAKSVENIMGLTEQYEIQENLEISNPTMETADVGKEIRKPQIVKSIGKIHGQTDNIENILELESSKPTEVEAISSEVKSKGMQQILKSSMSQGVHLTQEDCYEIRNLDVRQETGREAKEIDKTRERAKSVERIEGFENVFETVDALNAAVSEDNANQTIQKNFAQMKPISIEKELGFTPTDISTKDFEDVTTTLQKTVLPKTVQKEKRDRAKSIERNMGEYAEEYTTEDMPSKDDCITNTASTKVESNKKVVVRRVPLNRGELNNEETTKSIEKFETEDQQKVPVVSMGKSKCIEQASHSPKVFGVYIEEDKVEQFKPEENIGAIAEPKREENTRSRSKSVEKIFGVHREAETCEEVPLETRVSEFANIGRAKNDLNQHRSVDRSVGVAVQELSADDFEKAPTFLEEEANVKIETRKVTRHTGVPRAEGFTPTEDHAQEIAYVEPDRMKAKETKTKNKCTGVAHKRDKSVGYDISDDKVEDLQSTIKAGKIATIVKVSSSKDKPLKNTSVVGQDSANENAPEIPESKASMCAVQRSTERTRSQEKASRVSVQLGYEPMEEDCENYPKTTIQAASATSADSGVTDKLFAHLSSKEAGVSMIICPFNACSLFTLLYIYKTYICTLYLA